ncbi:MAG: hypothetical protein U0903_10900 [Planctomycetales bacterium]
MGRKENIAKKVAVKLELAKKYDSLASRSGGAKTVARMRNRAEFFRNQAAELARHAE